MIPSRQSIYDPLEDEDFDMDDVSEEEDEDEEEEEVEKGGSDSFNSYFCEKSRHYDDDGDDIMEDEDALWSASAQNGPQVLSDMTGIQSRPIPQSPAAAKAQRRLEKRPLRNVMGSDDLEATNGALLGSAISTAIASKASSHPRKRPIFRQSHYLDEESTTFPIAQLTAATSNLPVVDQPVSTQPVHRSTEKNTPDQSFQAGNSIVVAAKGKATFSRSASSSNLREGSQSGLPDMPGVPYSPRQWVAMHEQQEVLRQSRFSSPEAPYSQSPVRPAVYDPVWEGFYSTLPLGTVPTPEECLKYAPAGQEHLAYIPKTKSTQERSIHGHFFKRMGSDVSLVRCQVAMSKTRRVEGATVVVKEACGHSLAFKGSSQLRMKHIKEVHGQIHRALLEFRGLQEMFLARTAANKWQYHLRTATTPQAGYNDVHEDVLKIPQRPTRTEQDKFVSFLLSLVTKQGVSFATLASPAFKGMMAFANPTFTIPAVPTLQRILSEQVSHWKNAMVRFLADNMYRGVLTMDTWTNSTGDRKFLGVTLHFMNADYNMKTLAIGMAPMELSHSADYLCDELERIVDEWRLRGKLLSITTDGTSNMKRCVELFNEKQREQAQKMSWIHCAAHSIQLCINTALDKGKEKPDSAIALLKKCEHVVQFFDDCGTAKKALELEQKYRGQRVYKLTKPIETNWNSWVVMGARVHKLSAEIESAVDVVSRSLVKVDANKAKAAKQSLLSYQELCELQDVCKLLEPASALAHSLGGSRYPTISSVYPRVHGYALAPPLKPCATKLARDLHVDLTNQVEARFVVDAIPDANLVAMFLNPGCFDFPLFDVDSPFLIKAKDLAWTALLELAAEVEAATPAEPVKAQRSWKDVVDSTTNHTPRSRAQAELDKYFKMVIEDPETFANALDAPQIFWRDLEEIFPLMSVLARAYLCVQATSSESERLFSKAELLLPAKNIHLSYSNFFNILLHNSYEKFIESYTIQQPTKENTPTPTTNETAVVITP